jgi:uncharacterized protein YyaL (SSP411 family)
MWLVLTLAASTLSQAEGVKFFEESFESALKEAKKASKPVFIDFYTDWCGWCKVLDRETYPNKEVAALLTKSFVSIKVDAEKGNGPELSKRYDVSGFPTLLIVDDKGEELDRIIGYRPPEKFISELKPILAGKSFAALKKRVSESPSDLEAVLLLAKKHQGRGNYPESQELFKRLLSEEKTPATLRDEAEGGIALVAFYKSNGKEVAAVQKYFDKKIDSGNAVDHAQVLFEYHQKNKNTEKVIQAADYLVRHGFEMDAEFLNNYAWYLASHGAEPKRALEVAKKAVGLNPKSAHILDTLAEAYRQNGLHREAVETQKKAVEIAPDNQRAFLEKRLNQLQKALEESEKKTKES